MTIGRASNNALVDLVCLSIVICLTMMAGSAKTLATEPQRLSYGRVEYRDLSEASGLAVSHENTGVLWMHNDGASPRVYAISKAGKSLGAFDLAVVVTDVEDIAIGPGPAEGKDYVYVGDIGDNESRRRSIRICRFAEPAIDQKRRVFERITEVEQFHLTYPDGPRDAEALMVDPENGDLYVVSKEKKRGQVYRIPGKKLVPGETLELELVLKLKAKKVSGGDISRDGLAVILRTESDGWLWHRQKGTTVVDTLATTTPQEVQVRARTQDRNGESIGFDPEGKGYYSVSEGKHQEIYWFRIPPAKSEGQRGE
jgi:hypothetical protein